MMLAINRDIPAAQDHWLRIVGAGDSLFNEWEIRERMARLSGITPILIENTENNDAILLGKNLAGYRFYGGDFFNERNRIYGSQESFFCFLNKVGKRFKPIRLLSLDKDVPSLLRAESAFLEVPYNQYWVFPRQNNFEKFLSLKSPKRRKRIRSFFKRGAIHIEKISTNPLDNDSILTLMGLHSCSLEKRGIKSANRNLLFLQCLRDLYEYLLRNSDLYEIHAKSGNETVGYGSVAIGKHWKHAVYLVNFYNPSNSDASHMVISGAINLACQLDVSLDGMRGSFGLKRAYHFKPEPTYAFVNDPSWIARPQTDLTEQQLFQLYGRLPGYLKLSESPS